MSLYFEWDESKNQSNIQKHGISFEEARSVFYDDNARIIADPDHSDDEDRFLIIGLASDLRLMVVAHCYRKDADLIRIISARKATRPEARQYGEFL